MPSGIVFFNKIKAGVIKRHKHEYTFTYDNVYLNDSNLPAISLTIPKKKEPFKSKVLFPFFFGLLAEGTTKSIQCQTLKIDKSFMSDEGKEAYFQVYPDRIKALKMGV